MKKLIPQPIKNIYHLFQAILASLLFGWPSRKIKVIGVTGTNGKTTVCQMITKILEKAGYKTALISTINFKIGDREWVNETKFTTLSSFAVQQFIEQAVQVSCEYLVLETSSHSLDQNRVWGVKYNTAVITNITREHFDYHKTMEKYRQAKLKLFKSAKKVIVNLDMDNPSDFLKFGEEKYGYSAQNKNVNIKMQNDNLKYKIIKAENIELGINYTKYQIQDTKYQLNLLGEFNIENALAATCVGLAENISLEKIKNALEKIKNIPGRIEYVPNDKNLNIIIDYAVTPDSLEKLYELISKLKETKLLRLQSNRSSLISTCNDNKSKIIAVFGACGERDRGKRPIMGGIVSKYADYIILTNEDPYNEDPSQILGEVASGIKNKKYNENVWRIMNRREAIKKALRIAKPNDYVIVTGKGAETSMAIKNERIPWSDKKVIQEFL